MSKKSLEFHIKSNDYFGALATSLSLIKQTINNKEFSKINLDNLKEIEEDVMYLQKGYKIVKK